MNRATHPDHLVIYIAAMISHRFIAYRRPPENFDDYILASQSRQFRHGIIWRRLGHDGWLLMGARCDFRRGPSKAGLPIRLDRPAPG